jgi:hypothetical protein
MVAIGRSAVSADERRSEPPVAVVSYVETVEAAFPLYEDFDAVLRPWIREELRSAAAGPEGPERAGGPDAAARLPVRVAEEYARLRRELYQDVHEHGPQPPWRVIGGDDHTLVRGAPAFSPYRMPSYTLRRIEVGVPDGSEEPERTDAWEMTVIYPDDRPAVVHRVAMTGSRGKNNHRDDFAFFRAEVPASLRDEAAAQREFQYAFRTMDMWLSWRHG